MKNTLCPHFGVCGGCQSQHIEYKVQCDTKDLDIRTLLSKYVPMAAWQPLLPASIQTYYRSKMEYSFGGNLDHITLGLHQSRNTPHEYVVPEETKENTKAEGGVFSLKECTIFSESASTIVPCVEAWARDLGFVSFSVRKHTGFLRHLVLREAKYTKQILAILVHSSQYPVDTYNNYRDALATQLQGLGVTSFVDVENDALGDLVTYDKAEVLFGNGYIEEYIPLGSDKKLVFRIRPETFWQAHSMMISELYNVITEYLDPKKEDTVLDLYCGVGSISMYIAHRVKNVVGIEVVGEAINQARQAALLNAIHNVQFLVGSVEDSINSLDLSNIKKIIVDPPRVGLHPRVIEILNSSNVSHLVYVSCKPSSLLNDLSLLQQGGWKVIKARAVDMFPQTIHAEVVVLLTR